MTVSNQHSLKDLVIKLNDRNIQKQRESGFTMYTVYGALIFILIKLVEWIPTFLKSENFDDGIVILTLIANVMFSAGYFVVFVTSTRKSALTKIFPRQNFLSMDVTFIPFLLFFAMFAIGNFYSYNKSWSHSYAYLFYGSLMTTNLIIPLVIKIAQWWKNRKSRIRVPEFTFLNSRDRKILKRSFAIMGIIFSMVISHLIFKEKVSFSNEKIADFVQSSLYVMGALVGMEIILNMLLKRIVHENLEELEKRNLLKKSF